MIYNPHRLPIRHYHADAPADRVTLWLLVIVVVASVIALTFGDASGAAV